MTIERPFKTTYNWDYLEQVLRREVKDGPVPIIELLTDAEPMSEVTGIEYPAARAVEIFTNVGQVNESDEAMEMGIKLIELAVAFAKAVGYDYATMIPIVPLNKTPRALSSDVDSRREKRAWNEEGSGIITTRQEFNNFKWPTLDQVSMLPTDVATGLMPPGMRPCSRTAAFTKTLVD